MNISKLWNLSFIGLLLSVGAYWGLQSVINSPEMGGLFIALPIFGTAFASLLALLASAVSLLVTHRQQTKITVYKALATIILPLFAILILL